MKYKLLEALRKSGNHRLEKLWKSAKQKEIEDRQKHRQ